MDRLVNSCFLISITDLLSIVYAIAFTDRNRPTGGHPRTEFLIARKDRDLLLIKCLCQPPQDHRCSLYQCQQSLFTCSFSLLPPAQRYKEYETKSVMGGFSPDSFHDIDIVFPPASVAPPLGLVNCTSPKTNEKRDAIRAIEGSSMLCIMA